jgi:hypothetical protein
MSVTKFVLDYSKWRCGLDGHNHLGVGSTSLLNRLGYMCCLGQWCQQLGVTEEILLKKGEPWQLTTNADISLFASLNAINGYVENTRLSIEAMVINDELATTPAVKIEKLTNLLASYDIELEVINLPK